MTLTYQIGSIPGLGMPRTNPDDGPQGMDLVRQLAREIATKHDIDPEAIFGRSRLAPIVRARQELAWRLWRIIKPNGEPRFSFPQIGRWMGDLHHTTIIHAVREHERRRGAKA